MDDRTILDAHTSAFQIKKERNIKILFKDLFEYLIHDGSLLFRALSIYSLPIILFTALVAYFFLNTSTQIENIYYLKNHLPRSKYVFIVFNTLLYVVGLCLMTFVVNLLLILKDRADTESSSYLLSEFKKEFVLHFRNYVVNFMIVFVVYYTLRLLIIFFGTLNPFMNDGDMDFSPFNGQMNLIYRIIVSILFMPLILYYGFSSLFVSLRDNTGVTEVLQKIHKISISDLKKIWIACISMYFIGSAVFEFVGYLMNYALFLDLPHVMVFFIFFIQKLVMLGMFVFMNIGAVLMFGSVERSKQEPQNEPEELEPTIS